MTRCMTLTQNNDGSLKKGGAEMLKLYKDFCANYLSSQSNIRLIKMTGTTPQPSQQRRFAKWFEMTSLLQTRKD